MRARSLALHVVLLSVLITGTADAASRSSPSPRRQLDLVASAQPSEQRRVDHDSAFSEVMVRGRGVKADTVATTTTQCHGCVGASTALHVVYVPGPTAARFDNVASAWTLDCWDCTAAALSVQVVVVGTRTRTRATNRALAAGQACASCLTASAAFQLVVQVEEVGRLHDALLTEIRAWFDAEAAGLRAPGVIRSPPRARRAANRSLLHLRRTVVGRLDGRTLSARVQVTR